MASSAEPKKWGLLSPLSTSFPTDEERASNNRMIDELKGQNNFEAPDETQRRNTVLALLQRITTEFVKYIGKRKGIPQDRLENAGGKVNTFGSFRLGVFGPGSDIDTLIVAPSHVLREDFFNHFPSMLEKMSPAGAVEELKPVPDAHVPIIKLEFSGISIDLLFARLLLPSVPVDIDIKNDDLLRGLDDVDQRCMNGTRVADLITSLVPQEQTFRHTLRAIKLWAQRRAIYANIMGYPGGVAWAMMVANVCQSYPNACGSVVVGKFFAIMTIWNWPRPLMLKEIDPDPPGMASRIWNPSIYKPDKAHMMPIITPAYPAMCATHNISKSTFQVIMRELKRGERVIQQIYDGKLQWKDMFQKNTFFTKDFKYYLSVVSASKTKEQQLVWSGLVESRVRRLVAGIDESQPSIELARPYTKGFNRLHRYRNLDQMEEILHGKLDYLVTDSKSTDMGDEATHNAAAQGNAEKMEMPALNGEAQKEPNGTEGAFFYTTTYYIGIELAEGAKSLDISFPVKEFQRQCHMWPQYQESCNTVRVIHTRNYDLPDDVFDPGEEKPSKTKKVRPGKTPESLSQKRSFSATDMVPSDENAKRRQASANSVQPT